MNTATHSRALATAGQTGWADLLAKIVDAGRRRTLAFWSTSVATEEASPLVEANRVRNLAMDYMRHDPRFAADLFAAADRHESLHGR
ncbi:MAG TPA: hypothetical protein VFL86_06445 [Burkholderiaceae bacterium]|nr:hypothetical protein [Burkholderiaceae bacterium]